MISRAAFALIAGFSVLLFSISGIRAEQSMPLVSADWLLKNLTEPELVILDIRSPNSRGNPYANGHVPGAHHAPYNVGWRERRDGIIGMLPQKEKIVSHIRSVGVNSSSHVVIVPYGRSSTDFSAATRVYWTFKVMGHDRVSILEGGYKAWNAVNAPLSDEAVSVVEGDFDGKLDPALLTLEDEVQRSLRGGKQFVDARPVAQYEGRSKSPVVAKVGTIPGAQNLRQSLLYNAASGKFASRERILALSSELGLDGETGQVVAFCNTGHWASLAWFALHEIKGDTNVSVYDGSMTEWSLNDGNPVEVLSE